MAQRWSQDFITRGPWRAEDIPWLSTNIQTFARLRLDRLPLRTRALLREFGLGVTP